MLKRARRKRDFERGRSVIVLRLLVLVRALDELRCDRVGLPVEFLGVLDKPGRRAFVADRLGQSPRRRRALAISDHARCKLVEQLRF